MRGSDPAVHVGERADGAHGRPDREVRGRRARRPVLLSAAPSPVALACCAAVVVLLIDLAWATTRPGHGSPGTPVLGWPPLADVLLLAGFASAAAVSGRRTRNQLVRAQSSYVRAAEETKRLLQVIDNTSSVVYMRDCEGRYLLLNRTFERLFNVRREDTVGLTDYDVFPPEIADEFRANDRKALASDRPLQTEEVAPHEDGLHTYLTVKYPIDDAAGRHYAICGISTDITELKRVEQEVRLLNTDLEARVRARTAELEASTRELDAFAYSVSHDLRAPLRAVSGFSELLLEEYGPGLDAMGRDHLGRVAAAATRMSRLIDDLLKLSRASRAELNWRPVDLSATAQRIFTDLEVADQEPGREMDIVVEPGLTAGGDPALLELVLQNLISNAWKFTAKQDRRSIRVGSERLPDGSLAYFVRDNGVGFDMRHVDKLFAPFQRLHPLDDFAGSGIGLAIVGRVIARHGGRVWAEGRPDDGAVFRFVLPEHRPDGAPGEVSDGAPGEDASAPGSTGDATGATGDATDDARGTRP